MMNVFPGFALLGVALVALAAHALVVHAHLVRKLIALNVMGSGVFLVFGAVAYRNRAPDVDPVPQAMVLTGIVVAVAVTGFALALARRLNRETGQVELRDEEGLE